MIKHSLRHGTRAPVVTMNRVVHLRLPQPFSPIIDNTPVTIHSLRYGQQVNHNAHIAEKRVLIDRIFSVPGKIVDNKLSYEQITDVMDQIKDVLNDANTRTYLNGSTIEKSDGMLRVHFNPEYVTRDGKRLINITAVTNEHGSVRCLLALVKLKLKDFICMAS